MKRSAAVSCIFSLIFLAGLASAQSLAEIAKKEKEKRESAPVAQKVPIITEDELKRVRGGTFSVTGQPIWSEESEREPESRASFWAESAEEAEGVIRFRFINGMSYDSRILARKPPSLLVLDYFGSAARFELSPDGAGGRI
jgi:hypothetical protein